MTSEQLQRMKNELIADIRLLSADRPFSLLNPESETAKLADTLRAVERRLTTGKGE